MAISWTKRREAWVKSTNLNEIEARWALESIVSKEDEIFELEAKISQQIKEGINNSLKKIRNGIKESITLKESELDDISLTTPNSYKLQVSIPSTLNYLMKSWAAAEGRDLSSVALQCLEIGLRDMKSKGGIPPIAVERYEFACSQKVALAEISNLWDQHESEIMSD
tara:strand:- start:7054 stop:7554 length:501 start_codon:yes stop_codon:yes gene_type:complete